MVHSSIKLFKYYKLLADKAMAQISDDDLFHHTSDDENSISVIVQHMVGNMYSRWTNMFTEDGEKPWRNRDKEFENNIDTREVLLTTWENAWQLLFNTLDSIAEDDLAKIIYIRKEGLTVEDAILRQLCHYSYHVGQIVYKAKQVSGNKWVSLSIARNASEKYNAKKFDQISDEKHFLDHLMDESK
ncbi:MAG: DUF1572 family protein [Saprospiraceae bacterium]|nr:DUF1572 family protein [Saprospiraceae bacterium]